jgi:hypothetical protein
LFTSPGSFRAPASCTGRRARDVLSAPPPVLLSFRAPDAGASRAPGSAERSEGRIAGRNGCSARCHAVELSTRAQGTHAHGAAGKRDRRSAPRPVVAATEACAEAVHSTAPSAAIVHEHTRVACASALCAAIVKKQKPFNEALFRSN